MDGAELIRLLVNSNLTWAGALTIMSVVLRPVLLTLATGLVEARKEQTQAMVDRNVNEREQTKTLSELKDALRDNGVITNSVLALLQPVSKLPGQIQEIGDRMIQRTNARDELVRGQGQQISAIQQAITGLPDSYLAKTAAHFDPTLANIQTAINLLRQQIESRSEAITPDVVKEIRAELAKIARELTALSERDRRSVAGEAPDPAAKETESER